MLRLPSNLSPLLKNRFLLQRHQAVSSSIVTMMTPQQQQQQQQQQSYPQQPQTTMAETGAHHHHHHRHHHHIVSEQAHSTSNAAANGQVPIFNGINLQYPGLFQIYHDPPIYGVNHFLSHEECQFLIQAASDSFSPAPVVGKGAGEVSPTRTSSTCYLAREDLPILLRKTATLTGKPMIHMELPQVGQYLSTQQYYQHYDAFNLNEEDGRRFASNGGQRTVTVLVYLNDCAEGGQTTFPSLQINVQPQQGMALIFFPATIDGILDPRTLHAALPAVDTKYVSQIWIRQSNYYGQPSKRLTHIMGPPLTPEEVKAVPAGRENAYATTATSATANVSFVATPQQQLQNHHHHQYHHHSNGMHHTNNTNGGGHYTTNSTTNHGNNTPLQQAFPGYPY